MAKIKVTNPTLKRDYGEFELKTLIKMLQNPIESGITAMEMNYYLSGDELEFEIVETTNKC